MIFDRKDPIAGWAKCNEKTKKSKKGKRPAGTIVILMSFGVGNELFMFGLLTWTSKGSFF